MGIDRVTSLAAEGGTLLSDICAAEGTDVDDWVLTSCTTYPTVGGSVSRCEITAFENVDVENSNTASATTNPAAGGSKSRSAITNADDDCEEQIGTAPSSGTASTAAALCGALESVTICKYRTYKFNNSTNRKPRHHNDSLYTLSRSRLQCTIFEA